MKINLLSKALLMSGMLAMVACSNDEPVVDNGNNGNGVEKGDVAYMKVRIKSADKSSRATTSPADTGFQYGTKDENDVKNVRFFFFDATGASMDLTAYLVDPNSADINIDRKEAVEAGKAENVEAVFSDNLLVLEDMTSREYPSYMITVLNAPSFKAGSDINSTLALLENYKLQDYYVMSTSSFSGTIDNHDDTYYHATHILPTNFKTTPEDAVKDANVVNIFVERLAAKVEVNVNVADAAKIVTINGKKYYELDQTVAGDDNTENGSVTIPGENEDESSTTSPALNTKLYLEVLGWELNTTANYSYMSKNIDTKWTYDWWNSPDNRRSYWATSYVWGEKAVNDEVNSDKLTYVNTKNLTKEVGKDVAYCNENTNSYENIFGDEFAGAEDTGRKLVDSRLVTNVVLKTRIVELNADKTAVVVDEESNPGIDMVMANGVLFRKNNYMQYILNRSYGGSDALNLYLKVSDEEKKTLVEGGTLIENIRDYKQIGTEFFDLDIRKAENEVSCVAVILKENAFDGVELYSHSVVDGKDVYTLLEGEALTSAIAAAKTKLDASQTATGDNHAVMYDKGLQVYYIPVEHLAATEAAEAAGSNQVDGYYGVVRNHWYKLSINSFSKVGHGIWNPDRGEEYEETLKPETPENPLYYLGATINILSWKVVEQDVEL